MDKSIYTALNSMQILKNNQSVTSQNLSNTNVPGFKKDIHANFGSLYPVSYTHLTLPTILRV